MKKIKIITLSLLAGSVMIALTVLAAPAARTYQVTGPILELNDTTITVLNKDSEMWQIARDKDAKVKGELKVGAKVTIQYRMVATDIEVKGAKPADKVEKKK